MLIDVPDHAAHLRRQETPILCVAQQPSGETKPSDNGNSLEPFRPAPDCQDCGDHVLSCRCNPGEG